MSILLIGSGLLALGGLGAGFAMRRWRRGAAAEEAAAAAAASHTGSVACPVCLARGLAEAKSSSRNGV